MCLGIPARLTGDDSGHPDLAVVDMSGVSRVVNIGLLDEPRSLAPGDWVLVHMGFALTVMTAAEASDALAALGAEQAAEAAVAGAASAPGDEVPGDS
jgi:hydrogenase expression/formation protein HypC